MVYGAAHVSKDATHLSQLLERSAAARPRATAVEDENGQSWTYAALDRVADRVATRLARWGIARGDRVGIFLPKSLESVGAIQGILRAGAAYVPVDALAPIRRGLGILADAGVKAVFVPGAELRELRETWPAAGPMPRWISVSSDDSSIGADACWQEMLADTAPSPLPPPRRASDLAYILYTSGSTGVPKGVMLSHANAFCFLDWCASAFNLSETDRFASHAPFHFDLSVFDLYASCRLGASLVLVGEQLGKDPARLSAFLAKRRIDVWYSAPSILALMAEHCARVARDYAGPRLVLFAGEVFPIRALKQLRAVWPRAEMWNLYGPTETNVCTAFRVPGTIPADRAEPLPIGRVCAPLRARVVDDRGRDAAPGTEGELWISGPGVMRGYFGRPDLSPSVFQHDDQGIAWYRTGDLVVDDSTGCFTFRGRRDRMVKKRGYRIELAEIESALYQHGDVDRAAVLASADDTGVSITAFVAMKPGRKASIISMKRHCTLFLPHYMVPDKIAFLAALPATSTAKVDYQGLRALAER
jgi:amino acid adenylation domain-containing protein